MTVAKNEMLPLKPEWAAQPVRLDPEAAGRRQTVERIENGERVTYRVDKRGAVINRRLERAGLPISIALGAHAFKGIAARAMETPEGGVTVTLELHHEDPKLCVPLLVASDLYDVAADWRGWSELFSLPMLMIESDGSVVPLEETLGSLRTGEPVERRRAANKRRPRFLARRKPGGLGLRMVVQGAEIIARH
jgi:hypothetical protein